MSIIIKYIQENYIIISHQNNTNNQISGFKGKYLFVKITFDLKEWIS